MTESPATQPADGDVCQRAKNGLRPERNGSAKSLRRGHERRAERPRCPPGEGEEQEADAEEEVRPGDGTGEERDWCSRGGVRTPPETPWTILASLTSISAPLGGRFAAIEACVILQWRERQIPCETPEIERFSRVHVVIGSLKT